MGGIIMRYRCNVNLRKHIVVVLRRPDISSGSSSFCLTRIEDCDKDRTGVRRYALSVVKQ